MAKKFSPNWNCYPDILFEVSLDEQESWDYDAYALKRSIVAACQAQDKMLLLGHLQFIKFTSANKQTVASMATNVPEKHGELVSFLNTQMLTHNNMLLIFAVGKRRPARYQPIPPDANWSIFVRNPPTQRPTKVNHEQLGLQRVSD